MVRVFKEKDFQESTKEEPEEPSLKIEDFFSSLGGLQTDFSAVVKAAKKFPIRSSLTVIGFFAVLYIGFKINSKFVKI